MRYVPETWTPDWHIVANLVMGLPDAEGYVRVVVIHRDRRSPMVGALHGTIQRGVAQTARWESGEAWMAQGPPHHVEMQQWGRHG